MLVGDRIELIFGSTGGLEDIRPRLDHEWPAQFGPAPAPEARLPTSKTAEPCRIHTLAFWLICARLSPFVETLERPGQVGRLQDHVREIDLRNALRIARATREDERHDDDRPYRPHRRPSLTHTRRAIGKRYSSCLRNTTQALCPPKPNEFETPTWISDSRASFGM